MYPPTEELFRDFTEHHPEGKLELIEGSLIAGNSLIGSRLDRNDLNPQDTHQMLHPLLKALFNQSIVQSKHCSNC